MNLLLQDFFFLPELINASPVLQQQSPALHLQFLERTVQVQQHLTLANPASLTDQEGFDAAGHGDAELDIARGLGDAWRRRTKGSGGGLRACLQK